MPFGDSPTDLSATKLQTMKTHLDAAFFEKRTCLLAGHDERQVISQDTFARALRARAIARALSSGGSASTEGRPTNRQTRGK